MFSLLVLGICVIFVNGYRPVYIEINGRKLPYNRLPSVLSCSLPIEHMYI